jgi:ATP-dependent DNA ligase
MVGIVRLRLNDGGRSQDRSRRLCRLPPRFVLGYPLALVLTPIPPMMAIVATELPRGNQWSYEVKWDGYRAMVVSDGARARLFSRNLKDLTGDYRHIAAAVPMITPQSVVIDGEIVALD